VVFYAALALATVAFPLIWIGGLVTTFDAGMAVPDWPNTYGYNLFLYPLSEWIFGPRGLFVEHAHRLLGSTVGMLAIALAALTWWKDRRRWVRWLTVGALALVIGQGALGGIRVLRDDRTVALIHGCVGPAFFALAGVLCVILSRWWWEVGRQRLPHQPRGLRISLAGPVWFMLVLVYTQLVIGANLRHIPIDADAMVYRSLVVLHVVVALLIAVWCGRLMITALRPGHARAVLRMPVFLLAALISAQIGLGALTWIVKFGWPVWFEGWYAAARFVIAEKGFWQMNIITAHVACGSLILVTSAIGVARAMRWDWCARRTADLPSATPGPPDIE